ncbi:hypothetical protein EJW85_18190 [Escherichia coli]|nr:hypothetical protein [Escherichia coli]EEW0964351.1 hypothetical protein [Escherichia coli]EFO2788562.1 hypothetical protein [Escherichia coli]
MAKALDRAALWINASATCLQKVTAPTEFFSAIACIFGFGSATFKRKKPLMGASLIGGVKKI